MRLSAFADYYRGLVRFAPWRFTLGCLLSFAAAFLSGAGLLMVVPLLHFAGWLPEGAQTGLVGEILKRLPEPRGTLPLAVALGAYVLLVTLAAGVTYFSQSLMNRLALDYLFELRSRLNEAVARCEWSFLATRRLQELQHMINVGVDRVWVLTQFAVRMTTDLLVIAVYAGISLVVSVPLAVASIAIAGGLLLLHGPGKSFLLGKKSLEASYQLYEELSRFLDGVKPAKAGNLTGQYVARYETLLRAEVGYGWRFMRGQAATRFSFQVTVALILAGIFLFSVQVLGAPASSLLVLLLLLSRLMPHVLGVLESLRQISNALPAHGEMRAMLSDLDAHREAQAGTASIGLAETIRLRNVRYIHPGTEQAGLRGVNCVVPAGGITVVTGPSGAGKSTLADLLLGLMLPQSGDILIDGVPLVSANVTDWRSAAAYVPQEPYLFHESVRANLIWACPDATDEQIWQALEDSSASGFVRGLPEGLETPVGDRGSRLSGGERQRLALARALLRRPRLLVLDEVTSALDAANEEVIHDALRRLRGKVTIVIISHRPGALALADHVISLEGGLCVSPPDPALPA